MNDIGDQSALLKADLDRIMRELYLKPNPQWLLIDPKQYGMFVVLEKFAGRDRRRIKRELNKDWRKRRKAEIARGPTPSGVNKTTNQWWKNSALTATPTSEST